MNKSNDILRKQTALKGERNFSVLAGYCIVFMLHVIGVYWWYQNDDLCYPLFMVPPKEIPPFWHAIFTIIVNARYKKKLLLFTKKLFEDDYRLLTSLLHFYTQVCTQLNKLTSNVASLMISGYVKTNKTYLDLEIFREMLSQSGTEPDGQTILSALKACTNLKNVVTGRTLHGFIFHKGFHHDIFLGNSLIDMYSKCNDPDSALQSWTEIPLKNIISWNSIISGLVYNEKHYEAIHLFNSMQNAKMDPDAVTLVNLLQICKHFADPFICKSIHTVIIRRSHELNELVVNTLIDAYAKCNLIFIAQKLFSWIKIRDVVSWSTMIAAFTYCGFTHEAITVFHEMIHAHEKPNAITVLNLIEACSYDSDLKIPKSGHGIAIKLGFAADATVATAILDMYARYGDIMTSKKGEIKLSVLAGYCIVFMLHVIDVYWWYQNDDLCYPLFMVPPKEIPPFWHAIFTIIVNDTMVRQAAMAFKLVLLMYYKNGRGHSFCRQGQMLTLVEYTLLLYRAFLSAPVWYRFFLNKKIRKPLFIFDNRIGSFYAALKALSRKEVNYGSYATAEHVSEAQDLCAICQEKMQAPILLRCKHIFCEDCVSEWFERERTCPLCRALVRPADIRSFEG